MNKENLPLNKKGMAIGRGSKKKWQREQLILATLQQPTWQKAAASIGISEVTAWRIRQTPEFHREYLQARREAMSQSFGRLQQGSTVATSILLKIMVDPNNPASSVDAGIKRQQFRRFCSSEKTSHRRGCSTHSMAVSKSPA
jgi:hypothetical protein